MKTVTKWKYTLIPLFTLMASLLACHALNTLTSTNMDANNHGPVSVQGHVIDSNATPLENVLVVLIANDTQEPAVEPQQTGADGLYQFTVPGGADYLLATIPLSGQTHAGYDLHGHTSEIVFLTDIGEDVVHNFTAEPCHDFILQSYSADGFLVSNDDWIGTHFAEDTTGNATAEHFFSVAKAGEPELPSICIPLLQTRRFFLQWTIPGFGNVILPADNAGTGYSATETGATILNLNYELARTQVLRLQINIDDYQQAGYQIPPHIPEQLLETELQLVQAGMLQDSEQAAIADQASGIALWALEDLEMARAQQDIPRYRMGDLTITVLDPKGNPLPDATIDYNQTSHNFLFGVFDTFANAGTEGYELMHAAGINYITTGLYWSETEPEQDQIPWETIDHNIGVLDLSKMDFTVKAHALLALWDFATPDYLLALEFEDFNHEVYEHISALVQRYQDEIEIWNVINEAHGRGATLNFSREEITILTQTGIRAIREHDPDARIIINSSFDFFGESRLMSELDGFTLSVPAYLDDLIATGIDFDIIGQQLYNGGYVDLFDHFDLGPPMAVPTWDLEHLSAVLDQLGNYGMPVHITEQSVSSSWEEHWTKLGAGWWHHPWDEQTQAEFVHDFYTIVFSKQQTEAITWWNINDDFSFIYHGGLLDTDNKPKPAYYALRDLISSWTSAGQSTTDASGQTQLRGFGGDYALTVRHGDLTWNGEAHIVEQSQTEIIIQPGE